MTESGDPKENSQSERINSTTKNEFLKGKVFRSIDEANRAISKAIETYNTIRPHMSIDYMTSQEARECTGPLKKRWRSYREDAIQKARKDKESKELVTSQIGLISAKREGTVFFIFNRNTKSGNTPDTPNALRSGYRRLA